MTSSLSACFLSHLAICSSLSRAVCHQVNKDQSPCLRPQRSVQRTPELSSREGRNDQKTLPHRVFVTVNCFEVKQTRKNQEGLLQLKGQTTWITKTHFTYFNSNVSITVSTGSVIYYPYPVLFVCGEGLCACLIVRWIDGASLFYLVVWVFRTQKSCLPAAWSPYIQQQFHSSKGMVSTLVQGSFMPLIYSNINIR